MSKKNYSVVYTVSGGQVVGGGSVFSFAGKVATLLLIAVLLLGFVVSVLLNYRNNSGVVLPSKSVIPYLPAWAQLSFAVMLAALVLLLVIVRIIYARRGV